MARPARRHPQPAMARTSTPLRQALLEEARRLLLEEGWSQLSMRRIAAAAGCTATSIYLYFPGKDALIHALIEEGMERFHKAMEAALEGVADPRARVERICRAYLEFGLANPEYYEIMFLLHPRHMERYPREKYRRARRNLDVFADALRSALGKDGADPDRLQTAATVVWSALHGTVSLLIAGRVDKRIPRTALIEAAVRHATHMVTELRTPETAPSNKNR